MSRWSDQFKSHPFRNQWNAIKNLSETIKLTDETVKTDLEELARLRKVVTFVDELLGAVDPELFPQNIWNLFDGQAQQCVNELRSYEQNRNIGHMQGANANLDNILTYVRPYIVSGKAAAQAANRAFDAYAKTATDHIDVLRKNTHSVISDIQQIKSQANSVYQEIEQFKKPIQEFERDLFQGTPEEKGLKERIFALFEESKGWNSEILSYFQKLTKGNEQESSIILQIDETKAKALKDREAIRDALKSVDGEINDLNDFYIMVFGEDKEEGKAEGGLKIELEKRLDDLEEFKKKQQDAYVALIEEINSLLPGATSAGLATAFKDLKVASESDVKKYTKRFYCSLGILALMAVTLVVHKIGGEQWIEFIDISDPLTWFQKLIYKLPLLGPVLWFTLFASKRRSEFQRLQQEYAHKEALAKSYHGFKEQIERLNLQDEALMRQLLESVIAAISFNASETLDGKHGDKTPIQEIIEKTVQIIEKAGGLPSIPKPITKP
jgi:hypothetical protein